MSGERMLLYCCVRAAHTTKGPFHLPLRCLALPDAAASWGVRVLPNIHLERHDSVVEMHVLFTVGYAPPIFRHQAELMWFIQLSGLFRTKGRFGAVTPSCFAMFQVEHGGG